VAIKFSPGRKRFVWGDLTQVVKIGSPIEEQFQPVELVDFRIYNKTNPLKTYDEAAGLFKLGTVFYQMMLGREVVGHRFENLDADIEKIRLTIPKGTNLEAAFIIAELMRADAEARMSIPQLFQYLKLAKENAKPKGLEEDLVLVGGQPMPANISLPVRYVYVMTYGNEGEKDELKEELQMESQRLLVAPKDTWFWILFGVVVSMVVAALLFVCCLGRRGGDLTVGDPKNGVGDASAEQKDLENQSQLRTKELMS
jgi:hypothetical protein